MAKKKKKPETKLRKTLRIIKNVVFIVIMVVAVSILIMLHVGDIILTKTCDPMTLEDGDIITYNGKSGQFEGKRVTHRVVQAPYYNADTGEYYLVTKGDDNPVEDTPIEVSQVTGVFVSKLAFVKVLFDFFLTPWGLLVLIGLIILAFFNEIINFVKALLGDSDEEQEDIQDIIERVQREAAEKQKKELEEKSQKELDEYAEK